jgi:TonB family protein
MKYFLSIVTSVFILSCMPTASAQSNNNQNQDGDDHVTIYSRNHPVTKMVVITDAPTPSYTKAARKNKIEGRVTLRVVLGAWGKVTGIKPIKLLPDGLTEQAVAAAREIKFNPATINGRPVSMRFYVIYDFSLRRGVKVIPKDEL